MIYGEYLKKPWNSILRGKGRENMFSAEDLKWLDKKYFSIIAVDDYDLTIMSKNTGHYWYLHNSEAGVLVLFHRHSGNDPYHFQRRENTVHTAVRYIRKHNKFQLNGRRWGKRA